MLCTLIKEPFDDPHWIFETKWDGYRAFAQKQKGVKLLSRSKQSFNRKFPTLVKEFEKIKGSFVLDGEIVILDQTKKSNFQMLQNYYKTKKGTPYFYAFDILSLNGKDLRKLPLVERKALLKKLIRSQKQIRFSHHIQKSGKAFFKKAEKRGLEGIIGKKKESLYESKRSRNWVKIKTKNRQEVVIGGFTKPKGSRKRFGALLIGVYEKNQLKYVGRVGGGFNEKLLDEVYGELKKRIRTSSPFADKRSVESATWVEPRLVCEVEFTEWTRDQKLRHPIFKGLRFDKPAKKVKRE